MQTSLLGKKWAIKYVSLKCNSVLCYEALHHEKRNLWKDIGDIVVDRHTIMPSGEQFGLITHNQGPLLRCSWERHLTGTSFHPSLG